VHGCLIAQSSFQISIPNHTDQVEVLPLLFEDKLSSLTVEDILLEEWQQSFDISKQSVPNFGATSSAIWCKLTLNNTYNTDVYLVIDYHLLDSISFYTVQRRQVIDHQLTGFKLPYKTKSVKTSGYLYKLKKGQFDYYIRVKSSSLIQLPMQIITSEELLRLQLERDLIAGVFLGFIILMGVYNLFIYLSIKEKVFLSYMLFTVGIGLFIIFFDGYGFEFLWPFLPEVNQFSVTIIGLLVLSDVGFTITYLNTDVTMRRLHRLFKYWLGFNG